MKRPFSNNEIRHSLEHCHSLEGSFEMIKQVFDHQARYNAVFNRFLTLSRRPTVLSTFEDITFLPIELFKDYVVKTGSWESNLRFESSGTSGHSKSHHYVDDLKAYHERCASCFLHHTGRTIGSVRHLVFMPFYQSNPRSSLLSMMNYFVDQSEIQGSCFVTSEAELDAELRNDKTDAHVFIWTVTYGLLDYLKASKSKLTSDVTIVETGGMKGLRKEMTRGEIHAQAKKKWPDVNIGSEYGMCELFSQAYWCEDRFCTPNGFFVLPFSLDDPFYRLEYQRRGQLCFIDLANAHSCSFIATQDIGNVLSERQFVVEGRITASDLRGCNLMYG